MKIALIGCGRIGYLLENDPLRYKPCTHFGGAQSVGLHINYACDINIERLKNFSTTAKIPKENTFINYTELLETIQPEMVIISTWTESHDKICIGAAQNGARLIILEKPIASNLEKTKKLIDICDKNRVKLIINHERRYDNRYRQLKKIIDTGKIGVVKTVHASILTSGYKGDSDLNEGGGPLLHDGTHLVDIIRYLFGNITTVIGEFQRETRIHGFEDRALTWMKTEKNIDIFLEAGGNRSYFIFELEISGSQGKIIIGNGYEKLYIKRKSKFYSGFNDIDEIPYPAYKKSNCFNTLYKEAKNILYDNNEIITSQGIDGYRALEVIHAIYLSSYLNKKSITLPIKPDSVNLKKIFNL